MHIKNAIGRLFEFTNEHVREIGVILLIIPALLCLLYIWKYGYNAIYWDEWDFIPYFQHFFTGRLTFSDLFSLHNEHRIFFPRLIFLADVVFFHYYTKYLAYLSWSLLALILYMLYVTFTAYDKKNKLAILQFIPVAFLLFTFNQWESILYGQTICGYLSVFGFVAAVYLLNKTDHIDIVFLAAIGFGILSSYSYSSGLLVWPLGLLLLLISGARDRLKLSAAWSVAGICAISAYLYDFHLNPGHPSIFYALSHPEKAIGFLLANVSVILAYGIYDGLIMGGILIVLFVLVAYIVVKNRLVKKYSLLIVLTLFSLGKTGLLIIGRSGLGVGAGLTSRYIHITLFTVIGLYLIIVDLYNNKTGNQTLNKLMLAAMIIMIAYGVIVGYAIGIHKGETVKQTSDEDRYILLNYRSMPDDQLEKLYPDAGILRERIRIAEEYGLNVFYDNSTAAP